MNRIINIILLIGLAHLVKAQSLERQVVSVGGLAVQNSSAAISYTVGESFTLTGITSAVVLTQGFQQVDSTGFIGIPILDLFTPYLQVYPNPTRDILNIRIDGLRDRGVSNLYMQIIDLHGKLIKEALLLSDYESIDVTELLASAYIIRVHSFDGNVLQRVRFVKY